MKVTGQSQPSTTVQQISQLFQVGALQKPVESSLDRDTIAASRNFSLNEGVVTVKEPAAAMHYNQLLSRAMGEDRLDLVAILQQYSAHEDPIQAAKEAGDTKSVALLQAFINHEPTPTFTATPLKSSAGSFWDTLNQVGSTVGNIVNDAIEDLFYPKNEESSSKYAGGPLYDPNNLLSMDTINQAIQAHGIAANRFGEFSQNTAVYIPETSTESAEWKLKMLKAAKSSVEWSVNYGGGRIFRESLDVIEQKIQENPQFQAHLILSDGFLEDQDINRLKQLEALYPAQFHYMITPIAMPRNVEETSQENHIKLLVVDGKYVAFGGESQQDQLASFEAQPEKTLFDTDPLSAIKSRWLAGATDMDALCVGEKNGEADRAAFYEMWKFWERYTQQDNSIESRWFSLQNQPRAKVAELDQHPDLIQNVRMKMTLSGPSLTPNAGEAEYLQLIQGAQSIINIANLYFNPSQELAETLYQKANAGVAINFVTNGEDRTAPLSNSLTTSASTVKYIDLLTGSTEEYSSLEQAQAKANQVATHLFLQQREGIMQHTKAMSIDGRVAVIGSWNLGKKSAGGDFELLGTFDDPRIAARVEQLIKRDIGDSRELTLEEAFNLAYRWDYQLWRAVRRPLINFSQ